jgi:hypothetical protein
MHEREPIRFKLKLEGETMTQETVSVLITVNPAAAPFTVKDAAGNTVPDGGSITLSAETVGVADPGQTVVVLSGGTAPYNVALATGSVLPNGDHLDSTVNADGSETVVLSGTPTTAGSDSFSLMLSDSAGAAATVSARRKIA